MLVSHLLGERPDMAAAVQQWCDASESNRRYYEHFRLIWEESRQLAANSTVDEDAAWLRLVQRVNSGTSAAPARRLSGAMRSWMRAAAAAVLILCTAWLAYYITNNLRSPGMLTVYAHQQVLTDTLPDGSVVTLNKNAALFFPGAFKGKHRKVSLQGEAFFDISPRADQPFIIEVQDVQIKVLGTSFNVRNAGGRTEIVVETGLVEIRGKATKPVIARPHEKVTISAGEAAPLKQPNTDKLYRYYRTREFVCNNTPLWRLAETLQEAYNVQIIITSERLRNMPLTTTFRNQPLDSVLQIIGETFNTTIDKDADRIYIR